MVFCLVQACLTWVSSLVGMYPGVLAAITWAVVKGFSPWWKRRRQLLVERLGFHVILVVSVAGGG